MQSIQFDWLTDDSIGNFENALIAMNSEHRAFMFNSKAKLPLAADPNTKPLDPDNKSETLLHGL